MRTYSLEDFGHITSAKELVSNKVLVAELPTIEQVKTLARWNEDLLEVFNREREYFVGPPKQDRSAAMSRMAYYGAELGWSDEQIMAVLTDADDRWGKYKNRRDRERRLIDFINRARQKYGYTPVSENTFAGLIPSQPTVIDTIESKMVYGFEDFIDTEYKIEWTLDQLLAQGGFGLITGWPGTGKTTFCIQLGAYIGLGRERFLKWDNLGGSKKVLFLSLEMGAPPLNHFLSKIAHNYDDLHTLNRNFLVAPFGSPLPLDSRDGQSLLNNLLDEYMPDVLIIDSLQKTVSKELTDEGVVKSLVHYLSTIRAKYGLSLLIIHHNRKKPNDGQNKVVELSDVYGSTYITAEVDFVLNLRTLNPSLLSVDLLKNRLGPQLNAFEIARDENLSFSLDFEGIQERFGPDSPTTFGV